MCLDKYSTNVVTTSVGMFGCRRSIRKLYKHGGGRQGAFQVIESCNLLLVPYERLALSFNSGERVGNFRKPFYKMAKTRTEPQESRLELVRKDDSEATIDGEGKQEEEAAFSDAGRPRNGKRTPSLICIC